MKKDQVGIQTISDITMYYEALIIKTMVKAGTANQCPWAKASSTLLFVNKVLMHKAVPCHLHSQCYFWGRTIEPKSVMRVTTIASRNNYLF